MLEFTKALYELFVRQTNTLSQSLLIMKSKPKTNRVSRAAEFILTSLENGSWFSNALRSCPEISFDEVYISFVSIAEQNGDLRTALTYLQKKLERETEYKKKLAGASVYPTFVVLISILASLFIGFYTKTSDMSLLVQYVLILIAACAGLYFLIARLLCENKLYEAFTAVDFLLQNGIELSEAVGCAVQIAGPSSRIGKLFENARLKLLYGMDLQNAFQCQTNKGGLYSSKLKEAFYYADAGGSKNDLFGRMAAYLKSENERKRTICLSLIEPLFIVITGGFILLLLMTFFMPVITGFEFI